MTEHENTKAFIEAAGRYHAPVVQLRSEPAE